MAAGAMRIVADSEVNGEPVYVSDDFCEGLRYGLVAAGASLASEFGDPDDMSEPEEAVRIACKSALKGYSLVQYVGGERDA